ncbi:hypothetical protein DM02DRAFT_99594 [Periconia macrospinosa]|uniref:F-box domain-containing protein n=1 Tax=Periconia macrospinosa TaxID=97972 RepID=A0A2V1E5L9_9PLEO|nr:hypothetical protein DM02DRAFT_99594 [Periconia macrospinosa]
MGLLNIPLEILDVILDLSLPLGIEGLALSCKALYERATPQIRRHNALKRMWRCTNNQRTRRTDDTLQILYDIYLEPLAAQYIEVLDLWDNRIGNDGHFLLPSQWPHEIPESRGIEPNAPSSINFREDPRAMENLKEFIAESFKIARCEVNMEEVWADIMTAEMHPEEDDYKESPWTVVSLLTLLPNVTTLRLPGWWDGPETEIINAFESLFRAANRSNGQPGSLRKLKTILPFMDIGYEQKTPLQSVQGFMMPSSMRELYLVSAVAVDDGYTGRPFVWSFPELTSSITRMELVACCMDADGISALVSHTPNLAILKYSHQTKYHGCQHDWNPGTFIEAVGNYCGHSITELALTIETLYGSIVNGASSFRSYPHLRKLEIDIEIFCGPPVESGQRLGEDSYLPDGDSPWTRIDIPCIGSMLPESIKEVQINISHDKPDREALNALLKNLREQRAERLHILERVIIRQYNTGTLQDVADRAGATLELQEESVYGPYRRSHFPEWKRKFFDRVKLLLEGIDSPE